MWRLTCSYDEADLGVPHLHPPGVGLRPAVGRQSGQLGDLQVDLGVQDYQQDERDDSWG